MNRIPGVVKLQLRDKTMLYMPWMIVSISFVVNVLIAVFLAADNQTEGIHTGGLASLYVYMLVAGLVLPPQTFPFALGLGVRRKDYFWGTTAVMAAISALFSLLLLLLSFIEEDLTGGWGVNLHFFKLPYLNDGPVFAQLWIFFSCQLHMFYLGFAIAAVYRRLGKKGLWTLALVSFVVFTIASYVCTYFGWWGDIFGWLAAHTAFELSLYAFVGAVIYAGISYALLRRATV